MQTIWSIILTCSILFFETYSMNTNNQMVSERLPSFYKGSFTNINSTTVPLHKPLSYETKQYKRDQIIAYNRLLNEMDTLLETHGIQLQQPDSIYDKDEIILIDSLDLLAMVPSFNGGVKAGLKYQKLHNRLIEKFGSSRISLEQIIRDAQKKNIPYHKHYINYKLVYPTALHASCALLDVDKIHFNLNNGVWPFILNQQGKCALDLAAEQALNNHNIKVLSTIRDLFMTYTDNYRDKAAMNTRIWNTITSRINLIPNEVNVSPLLKNENENKTDNVRV